MDDAKKLSDLVAWTERLCGGLSGPNAAAGRALLESLRDFADGYIDFRMILNGMSEQYYITDAHERTLFVNTAYCRASKLLPEQLVGKTVTELVERDHYFDNPIIPQVIREGTVQQVIARVKQQKDPVCLIGTPIFDEDGTLRYAVSNDYRPEDISGLQCRFARFTDQLELQKKNAELDYYRQQVGKNKSYSFADPQMLRIVDLIKSIGNTDATVLITGESGTGKEVVADLLCRNSSRANQPFIKVNCAAIPEALIESELFGYEKGAFTGADRNGKLGMLELADKGTLFLDEIGELPLPMQTKLLRALQEKSVRRVGGAKEVPVDIRIIAATNRDLKTEVRERRFREDLFYRLNVIPIQIPALRDRPADIPLLAEQFLRDFCARYHRELTLDPDALAVMERYPWPGNIRELRNVVERLVVIHSGGAIPMAAVYRTLGVAPEHPAAPDRSSTPRQDPDAAAFGTQAEAESVPEDLNLKAAREALEIAYIRAALSRHGSKRQAAKALGIDHSTLVQKCQRYGI